MACDDKGCLFDISPCKTRKGYSVKPKHKIALDLEGIKNRFEVVMDADVLLVIRCDGEIIVHGYGELLFKDLKDVGRIEEIAREIYACGGVS